MPEAVTHAGRKGRKARLDQAQKLRRGRGSAAVVTHFEHVGSQRRPELLDELPLFLAFGVTGEQKAALAIADPEHERVVVRVTSWGEMGTGGEHVDAHAPEVTGAPAQLPRSPDGDAVLPQG